jgi:predicted hotdog family 3-hydroxylacyl-ACP dehydratase
MMSPLELLPHASPMMLLDEVVPSGPDRAVARRTVGADDRFAVGGRGVPAHIAIEWMAQACGIFAGRQAIAAGRPVRFGLLLGTRRFHALRPWFEVGEALTVRAVLVLQEAGMGVFDCAVDDAGGVRRASAQLTTFQPPEGEV